MTYKFGVKERMIPEYKRGWLNEGGFSGIKINQTFLSWEEAGFDDRWLYFKCFGFWPELQKAPKSEYCHSDPIQK